MRKKKEKLKMQEILQPEEQVQPEQDLLDDLSLEDILKEFGEEHDLTDTEECPEEYAEESTAEILQSEDVHPAQAEVLPEKEPAETMELAESEETADEAIPPENAVTLETDALEATTSCTPESDLLPEKDMNSDTIRLDDVAAVLKEQISASEAAAPLDEEPVSRTEPFSKEWEPDYDAPMGDYVPPEPIIFQPKSRLRELKRKLVAGPEKRYYELAEQGLGKLQISIFLNFLVVVLAAGSTALYGMGAVPEHRLKLLIFAQVLAMLLAGLLGSFRLLDGAADLLKGHFSFDTLIFITFLACCADGVFCLTEEKVPCCAAFSLEMLMCQWGAYHRRVTEMGQMDTLRKATFLDGLAKCPDFYESRPGFLRKEAQVEDFMDHGHEICGPEKTLRCYGLIAVAAAAVVGIIAGVLHDLVFGVRAFAAALLAAVPVTMFITLTRPAALLEKRLHSLGTVICGWRGIKNLSAQAAFPLNHQDLFPSGATKMNGVKFFGEREPDEVVAYAAALIEADGGGLHPLFHQLLESRNGYHYEVENFRCYGNGGIGGEIQGEPVLVGIQPFLQSMGVEIPEGTRVNQAVYVAIDGMLSGVFAITYSKVKSSAKGLETLCSCRGLCPVLTAGDFMFTEGFLRGKFGINTRRMAFPEKKDREALAARQPEQDEPSMVLMTKDGLASAAYGVTGARALHTASVAGTAMHLTGGILGFCMMLILAILGAEELLTPVNLLLYQLLWMIPGLLITEWTRSI